MMSHHISHARKNFFSPVADPFKMISAKNNHFATSSSLTMSSVLENG